MEGKSAFFIIRGGVLKTQKDEQFGGVEVRTPFPDIYFLSDENTYRGTGGSSTRSKHSPRFFARN
jgi:hypothetical protein